MIPLSGTPLRKQIIEPLIELARCSKRHRFIVAGSKSAELMSELYLRGYVRVATTATCGLPHGQYDVALVNWQGRSIEAIEATLDWLVHFLASSGVLVIWIDSPERTANQRLESILERLGFHVEVGTLCDQGLAILGRRRNVAAMTVAA
jgi:hypothetical protein